MIYYCRQICVHLIIETLTDNNHKYLNVINEPRGKSEWLDLDVHNNRAIDSIYVKKPLETIPLVFIHFSNTRKKAITALKKKLTSDLNPESGLRNDITFYYIIIDIIYKNILGQFWDMSL